MPTDSEILLMINAALFVLCVLSFVLVVVCSVVALVVVVAR